MADLPPDILLDILAKLPVKTLTKCRCVSKYWRCLISDPKFIARHLHIATTDHNHTHHRLLSTSTDPDFSFKSCSVFSIFHKPSLDAIQLVDVFGKPVEVVGSCNGLVCIAVEREVVYLWNPTIREVRRLPVSGFGLGSKCSVIYGFGYDSSSDDYKVVAVLGRFDSKCSDAKTVMVYGLRCDRWRRIDNFPYGPINEPGFFVGGALHWTAVRPDWSDGYQWDILSIDLATEEYIVVPKPVQGDFDHRLALLGECLFLLTNYRGNHADIWVMTKYRVKESWCKMFTIPYEMNLWYRPLLCSKNGEILLMLESCLVLYNSKSMTFRKPVIHNFPACHKSITYVESLVSPNARGFC